MSYSAGKGFYPTSEQGAANLFSIVHRNFNPFLIKAALRKRPIFLYLALRDLVEPRAGGFDPIVQPVQLTSYGGQITTMNWTGTFTTSPITNPLINASWAMSMKMISMDVLATEYAVYQGAASQMTVIDNIKARFTDYYEQLLDHIETTILTSASNNHDMNGLGEAVDDGTTHATYGNIDRATYPAWSAPKISVSLGTGDPAWLAIPYVLHKYRTNYNGLGPTLCLCSYGTFHAIGKSLMGIERVISATPDEISFTQGAGFQALNINGIWLLPLSKLTGNTAYFIDPSSFKFYIHPDFFFAMTPPVSLMPTNVFGWRTGITFAGNFVSLKPWNNIKAVNMPYEAL